LIPVDPLGDSNPLDLDMIIERFCCLRSLRTIESEMIESHGFWTDADQIPFGRNSRVFGYLSSESMSQGDRSIDMFSASIYNLEVLWIICLLFGSGSTCWNNQIGDLSGLVLSDGVRRFGDSLKLVLLSARISAVLLIIWLPSGRRRKYYDFLRLCCGISPLDISLVLE
jgi:hypothetical protein